MANVDLETVGKRHVTTRVWVLVAVFALGVVVALLARC